MTYRFPRGTHFRKRKLGQSPSYSSGARKVRLRGATARRRPWSVGTIDTRLVTSQHLISVTPDTVMLAAKILAAAVGFLVLQWVHLAVVMKWSQRRTRGLNYFGASRRNRRRFKRLLRVHSLLLTPLLTLLAKITRPRFSRRSFSYRGTAGPGSATSAESFRRAEGYRPRPEDVFVVTHMRSGTTWMQHLVYQVLSRGRGDLSGRDVPLNAVSPWLEAHTTVGVDAAPVLGDVRPSRLIKTHLPAPLCPWSAEAKYVYVVRHPASCFASCIDFVRGNLRGFAPNIEEFERWFRSDDLMWWNTWVAHVGGWLRLAGRETNILLVRFEDMKSDLGAIARQVAAFLEMPRLTEPEWASVVEKCGFAYMREHADVFEMHPPHLLQAANPFFVSGKANRFVDMPAAVGRRIGDWCLAECDARGVPVRGLYPELARRSSAA